MILQAYRCQACEHVYLGEVRPDKCPHCGVSEDLMVTIDKYVPLLRDIDLDTKSLNYALEALELEETANLLYRQFADETNNILAESYYRRFARHEDVHAEELEKILGEDRPTITRDELESFDNDEDRLNKIIQLENNAVELYNEISLAAENFQVRYLFRHLIEVEASHSETSEYLKNYIRQNL